MSGFNRKGKPGLVIYEDISRANIRRMHEKALKQGIELRPHFKTHQSHTVGRWYREEGIKKITVSSVSMAMYFAADGWDDITIAFPFNPGEADQINELSKKIRLNIIVSTVRSAELAAELIINKTGVFIEIDTGYPRTGLKIHDRFSVAESHRIISESHNLEFRGFLSHFGHSYSAAGRDIVSEIWKEGIEMLIELKAEYPGSLISAGDTPCCSIAEDLSGADEIRPGNFVFYDLMQLSIGSCLMNDVAVTVLCTVAAVYKGENKAVLYAGAVHLSKDSIIIDGLQVFGMVGVLNSSNKPEYMKGCFIVSLSQEHAVVRIPEEYCELFTEGMTVAVMPVHSCLTLSCMREAFIHPGNNYAGIMKV